MSDWKLPWKGHCRCGKVKFTITAPPLLAMACHCTGCQRMSSSAFSLSLAIPEQGFAITEGKSVLGGLRGEVDHHFCPHCMTWVFTVPKPSMGFVNVRPTMLEEPRWVVPFVETYTSEKLPWATTPARHSFEKFPDFEAYGPLVAEFAERGARPN